MLPAWLRSSLLFLATDDFACDHARFTAAGVEWVRPPADHDYGRVAVFADLYGNPWDLVEFSEPTEPPLLAQVSRTWVADPLLAILHPVPRGRAEGIAARRRGIAVDRLFQRLWWTARRTRRACYCFHGLSVTAVV